MLLNYYLMKYALIVIDCTIILYCMFWIYNVTSCTYKEGNFL